MSKNKFAEGVDLVYVNGNSVILMALFSDPIFKKKINDCGGRNMNTKNELKVAISLEEKKRRLSKMSENDFRDKVVLPLFLALGYKEGRVLHGSDEEGKDLLFIEEDKFGRQRTVCVQTKKGKINMASGESRHATTAVAQLRTALSTKVARLESSQQHHPDEVFLCVSGTINTKARNYICGELSNDSRIKFLDAESLINSIDEKCPRIWEGISADVLKHYDAIRRHVEKSTPDVIAPHAHDRAFVSLNFYRHKEEVVKHRGQHTSRLKIEELSLLEIRNKVTKGDTSKPILIVGEAGSGKSTALWRIAYDIIRYQAGEEPVPVVVSARDINSAGAIANVECLVDKIRCVADDFSQSENLVDVGAKQGRLILLIDAIDEVVDENDREKLIETIINLNRRYPSCAIIVTSRHDEKTRSLFERGKSAIYDIAPISWKQVQKIVGFVLTNRKSDAKHSESIVKDSQMVLRQMGEVHGFKITPLLATVYATSAEYSRGDIPANITELFKKYTEQMLGRWDETKGLQQQFHAPLKDFLLKEIAYGMHKQKSLWLTRSKFREIIAKLLAERGHHVEIQGMEKELIDRSRLLREVGDHVEFSHLLLQEFFAGRAMPESEIAKKIGTPWWAKPIMFYYGENPGKAGHLRSVQQKILKQKPQKLESHRTVGFALQASYLSLMNTKIDVWTDVVRMLSEAMVLIEQNRQHSMFSLSELVIYYLEFRDAVAFHALRDESTAETIADRMENLQKDLSPTVREAVQLWHIVSLLQSDLTSHAAEKVKNCQFENKHYPLLIYMGAMFISEILPASKAQKREARGICARLEDKIAPYMKQLTKEFQSMLLEKQRGKIVAVQGDDK